MGKQHQIQGLLFGDKKPKELNIIAHIIKYYDFFFQRIYNIRLGIAQIFNFFSAWFVIQWHLKFVLVIFRKLGKN